jgi:hypothetical protein
LARVSRASARLRYHSAGWSRTSRQSRYKSSKSEGLVTNPWSARWATSAFATAPKAAHSSMSWKYTFGSPFTRRYPVLRHPTPEVLNPEHRERPLLGPQQLRLEQRRRRGSLAYGRRVPTRRVRMDLDRAGRQTVSGAVARRQRSGPPHGGVKRGPGRAPPGRPRAQPLCNTRPRLAIPVTKAPFRRSSVRSRRRSHRVDGGDTQSSVLLGRPWAKGTWTRQKR